MIVIVAQTRYRAAIASAVNAHAGRLSMTDSMNDGRFGARSSGRAGARAVAAYSRLFGHTSSS